MERKCTNIYSLFTCSILIIAVSGLLIAFTITKADIFRLTNGFDDCGNVCGRTNKDLNIPTCTAKDMTENPKLRVILTPFPPNKTMLNYECVPKCAEGYEEIFNRCVKKDQNQDTDIAGFLNKIAQDFVSTWPMIILSCFLAAIFSYVLLILFRYAIEYIIWIIYIGFVLAIGAGAIFVWILYFRQKETGLLISAIVLSVFVVLTILILVWFRKRIKLVAQLFKEASKALIDVTSLLFEPILTFISLMIVIGIFLTFVVFMQTAGDAANTKNLDGSTQVTFPAGAGVVVAKYANIIAFIWMTSFLFGCQNFVIAGTICKWYFARDKSKLSSPVFTTFYQLIRYHLGSVCLGSSIITLVKILRMIVEAMYSQAREDGNFVGQCLACICAQIMQMIEEFLKYLIRNAYIIVAKDGISFIKSGKKAFKLLFDNLMDVIALNQFGDIVLVVARLLVVALTTFIAYYLINKPNINYPWAPIVLTGIFAFLIAHCFVTVFEMTVDTIFVCFCDDIVENDGDTKPYFMSPQLMEVMRKLKSEAGGDFNFGSKTLQEYPQDPLASQPYQQGPYPVTQQPQAFYPQQPPQPFYPQQSSQLPYPTQQPPYYPQEPKPFYKP